MMMSITQNLTHLESTGLIRLAQSRPELEYLFRHALVQDAAYESLLLADRKQMHQKVAETLEHLYPDQLDEFAPMLGYHFARTGKIEKAVDYLLLAGEKARGVYANQEAIEYFRQALALLQNASSDVAQKNWRNEVASQLHESLGDILEWIGQHNEARGAYEEALTQVPKVDLIWQARLHRKIAYTCVMQRQDDAALQAYSLAETALGKAPTESNIKWWQEWVQIQLELMEAYYWQAQPHKMSELAEEAWSAVEQYGTPEQRISFLNRLVQANFRHDRYIISDETRNYIHAMWTAARELDDLGQRAATQFTLAFGHLWLGEFDEAEKHLTASLSWAERAEDVTHQARCLTYLTILYRKLGKLNETRHYASRALTIAQAGQMVEYIATAKANLAWERWCTNHVGEAQQSGRSALELWPDDYPFQWTALWPLIAMALAQDQLAEVVEYSRVLLEPTQQRLPDELTVGIEEAVNKWEVGELGWSRRHFDQALELAKKLGYL